jgi:predicted metal-dependent hydrolase
MAYHPLYIEFLYHFNMTQDYYECHEVMEAYWLEEGRNKKLQSFLQIAVGLYHYRNGNLSGAKKLFEGALEKKETHWNGETGIDEEDLYQKTKSYLTRIQQQLPFSPFFITIKDPLLQKAVENCQPKGTEDE